MREGQKDHCLNCNARIVWTYAEGWVHIEGGEVPCRFYDVPVAEPTKAST